MYLSENDFKYWCKKKKTAGLKPELHNDLFEVPSPKQPRPKSLASETKSKSKKLDLRPDSSPRPVWSPPALVSKEVEKGNQACQVVQFSCILYRNSLEIQEYSLYLKIQVLTF